MHNRIRCIKRNDMMLVEVCHIERCWKSYINRIVYVKLKLRLWKLRHDYRYLGVMKTFFLVVLTYFYRLVKGWWLQSGRFEEAKIVWSTGCWNINNWPRPRVCPRKGSHYKRLGVRITKFLVVLKNDIIKIKTKIQTFRGNNNNFFSSSDKILGVI